MIPESEISEFSEHKVKAKIGKVFLNKKIFEEYCVKIMKLIHIFMSITKN